ncbi:hypothetical protein, partial [Flavobacterium sp.]|uniref:hypothetical protein n=1 Tax=Flavobacterium sp. TaxID=239 RepID=UPI00262568EC
NYSISKFLDNFSKSKKMIGVDLSDLEIENDDDVTTTLYYKDDKGKQAHAKVEQKFQITPAIVLPNELIINENIDYDSIRVFTDGILDIVKKEINYTTGDEME